MNAAERLSRHRFQPGWKLSLFVVLLLPLLIWLGFWQLHRADEKRVILAAYDTRRHAPPVSLGAMQQRQLKAYQRVVAAGRFRNDRVFLLDNRVYQGQPGFEVITPMIDATAGQIVFVNRGWVAGFADRSRLPSVAPVPGEQRIVGEVYLVDHDRVAANEWALPGWPKVIQSIDIPRMAAEFHRPVFGALVRLPPESPWSFRELWQPVNMPPERHVGYAVQWFSMAVVLVGLYLATGFGGLRRAAKNDSASEENSGR